MAGSPPELKKAFVIQAIGSDGSATRARADRVLDQIIRPACRLDGYEAVRADELMAKTIAEPIISALNTHPLVVADLAAPPWNANVLTEVGFRLATGRPIVFLADGNPSVDIIPLHLRNVRIHQIDPSAPTTEDVDTLAGLIREHGKGEKVNSWESHYPIIEFSLPLTPTGVGRFIYANPQAAGIYGKKSPDDLIGHPVDEIDRDLHKFIPDFHRQPYDDDQAALVGKLIQRAPGPLTAKVPLWFTNHTITTLNNKVYWPVLVQHRYASDLDLGIVLRVLFADVTEWARHRELGPRAAAEALFIPELFRDPDPPRYDAFLSYNSADGEYVAVLHQFLTRFGLSVWYDEQDIRGDGSLAKELIHHVNQARIFLLVVGPNGLGRWQGEVELASLLRTLVRGRKPFITLVLPDGETGDAWTKYVDDDLAGILGDKLYYRLPDLDGLKDAGRVTPGKVSTFTLAERLIKFFVQTFRARRADE
jgi:hypothetical protein